MFSKPLSLGSSPNAVTFILVPLAALFPELDTVNVPGEVKQPVLSYHAYPEDKIKSVLCADKVPVLLHALLNQHQFLHLFPIMLI